MRRRAMPKRGGGQTGQVLPLILIAMLLAGLAGLGLIRLAVASSRRAGAQAAADAAALAGAADGEGAARRLAAANGAEVLSYRTDGFDVEVVVRRHGVSATARARWLVVALPATLRPTPSDPEPGSGWGRRLRSQDQHPVCSPPCQPTAREPPTGGFRPTLPDPARPDQAPRHRAPRTRDLGVRRVLPARTALGAAPGPAAKTIGPAASVCATPSSIAARSGPPPVRPIARSSPRPQGCRLRWPGSTRRPSLLGPPGPDRSRPDRPKQRGRARSTPSVLGVVAGCDGSSVGSTSGRCSSSR